MSYEPTPTQALLLFGILARHGECAQSELKPAVKKVDREALIEAKLIRDERVGGRLRLTLTDDGWAWAGSHLQAELPPAQRTLSDMLARLGEHFTRSGETLGDFIGTKPDGAEKEPKPRSKLPKGPTAAAVRKRIVVAYLKLTGNRKNESVRLSQLRAELSDLDRATVDAALGRILEEGKKASLMRHDDPDQLDEADHDAAFNPSGEPFHVLWISS